RLRGMGKGLGTCPSQGLNQIYNSVIERRAIAPFRFRQLVVMITDGRVDNVNVKWTRRSTKRLLDLGVPILVVMVGEKIDLKQILAFADTSENPGDYHQVKVNDY